jgi:hypothetical protein
MKYRKLRIAWSVWWGVGAVLLIALWVRSYWWCNSIYIQHSTQVRIARVFSMQGRIGISSRQHGMDTKFRSFKLGEPMEYTDDYGRNSTSAWIRIMRWVSFTEVLVPYWLVVFLCGSSATAPWIAFRFSLRTLLIATTLVGVLLGLIVWLR